jgi:hypothetical protein
LEVTIRQPYDPNEFGGLEGYLDAIEAAYAELDYLNDDHEEYHDSQKQRHLEYALSCDSTLLGLLHSASYSPDVETFSDVVQYLRSYALKSYNFANFSARRNLPQWTT